MKKLIISTPFETAVIKRAKEMVLKNQNELIFIDEHNKKFDGVFIFIDNKPQSTLFTFEFPADFVEGLNKKIFIGNN